MGIVRTVLISTIDLRNPKSLCTNLSLRKFKKVKFQYFPLYFGVHSLVKIKVQFWEGRWPGIKKFRKQKLLSTKFYKRKHVSQIWNTIFLNFSFFWPPLSCRVCTDLFTRPIDWLLYALECRNLTLNFFSSSSHSCLKAAPLSNFISCGMPHLLAQSHKH